MSFGFVILNYNTYCETVELIKTIDRIFKGEENKIVIVDNASQDYSLEKFKLLYEDDNNVCILQMPYNMGFSKANNEGYKYLRPMNLDFIFICNSDIEFQQKNFKNELLELYKSIKFDICGPDVWAPNMKKKYYHGHQSPAYPWEYSAWYTQYTILNHSIRNTEMRFKLFKRIYCMGVRVFQRILTGTVYKKWRQKFHKDTAVHGSCIILSKRFIEQEKVIFEPETKFYFEELLLYLKIKKKNYISVYSPNLQITHLQGRSTSNRNERENGSSWIDRNIVESAYIYLEQLRKEK